MRKLSFIHKGESGTISFETKHRSSTQGLFLLYGLGVTICFLIALARLFQLTVVKGNYFSVLSDDNRVKEIIIEAPRGTITDRKGIDLATSTVPDSSLDYDRITSRRVYQRGPEISHVIGYRQAADKDDLEEDSCINKLKFGDKVGKKGVEGLFECDLRGKYGKKLIEVDAHGAYSKTLSILPPTPGKKIALALDSALQEVAYASLDGRKGSVVGLKPETGEVLVLASSPGFDPQVFEDGDTNEAAKLISDEEKPLFNRATEGIYPPGSTFKLFVSAAGLEEGVVKPEDTITDEGVLQAGPLKFHNWYYLEYGRTDGEVDLIKALKRSNDIYYYLLGGKLGPERIKKWAEIFGFQNDTNIGISEVPGVIPSTFWKKDTLGERWFLGDTYNLSIGQGYVATTPLQVARATAVFANEGYICQPKLLKNTSEKDSSCEKVPISRQTYDTIREGMWEACVSGGTGYPFFDFQVKEHVKSALTAESTSEAKKINKDATSSAKLTKKIEVGCKTGTAESHALSGKPHAWFTVFAPYEDPEIVLTVLVEEGGQGSQEAAPIAKEILTTYFETYE